jgi:hypothetical protein
MLFEVMEDLSEVKSKLHASIDKRAGEVRLLFITDAPGQDMVYQQKRREAEAYLANPSIDPQEIPHIAAEATAQGVSLSDKATEIIGQSSMWATVSAVIEARRLTAKSAVTSATSCAQAQAAANVDWSDISSLS